MFAPMPWQWNNILPTLDFLVTSPPPSQHSSHHKHQSSDKLTSRHSSIFSIDQVSHKRNQTWHPAHLQRTRPTWKSDAVWNNINMQGLGIAFKSQDTTPSCHLTFTSKMLHGWLNTGHQRAKFTKDLFSSLCPCCNSPDETFEHILQCTAPMVETAQTTTAKTKLSSLSKKRGSTTWKVLYQALCNWLKFDNQMQHPCLNRLFLKGGQRTVLETALQNQDKIGWIYAMHVGT
jgi:hypothetical protein